METITVQGVKVPALGFGTWKLQADQAREGVRHALEIGYRQIDTAQNYENEAEVGRGLVDSGVSRDEVFVTTKIVGETLAGDRVGPATDASLERLGTDWIDLLLIHWPSDDVPLGETLEAMMDQQGAGKVRHLGVSNFDATLLREALDLAPILADQVPYQPGRDQDTLLGVAAEHDVMITAYSPLKGDGVKSDVVGEVAAAHDKSPQQVALRWLLQQDRVSPIPRSGDPDHRRQNADVFDFELSDEEMRRIHQLSRS